MKKILFAKVTSKYATISHISGTFLDMLWTKGMVNKYVNFESTSN